MPKKGSLSTSLLAEEPPPPAAARLVPAPSPAPAPANGSAPAPRAGSPESPRSPRSPRPGSPPAGRDAFRPSPATVIQPAGGDQVLARTLFDEAAFEAARAEEGAKRRQKLMFIAFCLLEIVANFDAGLLPAAEMHVSREFHLSHEQAGMLGSLVYFGMVIGTPLAGYFLTNTPSECAFVILAAALNTVSILIFALAPTRHWLYVGRTLMGVSQGAIFVYAPVWVDEFSPKSRQALWMATLQGSVVFGIVLGYVVTGAFVGYWQPWTCNEMTAGGYLEAKEEWSPDFEHTHLQECYNEHWKYALYLQATCMSSFVLLYSSVDDALVNSKGGEEARIRWRTHALYREKIVKLNPVNIDASVRKFLDAAKDEASSAPVGIPAQMRKNLGAVVTALTPRKQEPAPAAAPDRPSAQTATQGPAPRAGTGARRGSLDLLGIGSLGDLAERAEDGLGALGAGSMSGGHVDGLAVMELFGEEMSGADTGSVTGGSVVDQLKMLCSSSLYVKLTLALCGLYYVVTGTQFWITEYATEGLNVDAKTVLWSFSFVSITAPTLGVFMGGWYIDRQGGYKDEMVLTLRICCYFTAAASAAAVPAIYSVDFSTVMMSLWTILFFGGALLSPATGVCINAVHPELRSFSSAMSMFAYNLLGYGMAPVVGGLVADAFTENCCASDCQMQEGGEHCVCSPCTCQLACTIATSGIRAGYQSIVFTVFIAGAVFVWAYGTAAAQDEQLPLDDAAVVELLKRVTQDSTGHASSEDLATLRQASTTAGPEQANMMAVWIAERMEGAMGAAEAASPPVVLKSLTAVNRCLALGPAAHFKAAVAQHCAAQLAAALEFSVADPQYGDKPASLIRKMAAETQALLA